MKPKVWVCGLILGLVLMGSTSAIATHDPAMGVFADQSFRVPFVPDSNTIATDVEFLDFDADGDLDLYVTRGDLSGNARRNVMFKNDGSGTYTSVIGAGTFTADFADVDFSDLTGDGLVDAVLSTNLGIERLM